VVTESYADWLRRALSAGDWNVVLAIFDEMSEDEWKECLLELAGIDRRPDRVAELEGLIREMHAADEDYGRGFYNQSSWLAPYRRLREIVGLPNR
jgi:hypothetical protein